MALADDLARRFGLTEQERGLLAVGPAAMDRRDRRIYHAAIQPRLGQFRAYLEGELERGDPETARRWATATAFAIVARGHASVIDQLVIDIVGRRTVSAIMDAARGSPGAPR